MRVSVVQGGGFAGLVTTTTADAAALAPDDAHTLRQKVDAAAVFELPDPAAARGPAQPDRPSFELTVQDGRRHRRLLLDDADLEPGMRALIEWVGSVDGREEQIGPPG